MLISDHTLLLAIGFSALCVVVMFIVTWFSTRSEPFLLTWAAGTAMIVFCAFGFAFYNIKMTPWVGLITFATMIIGLGAQFSASIQFRTGRLPFLITGPVILLGVLAVGNAMFSGYNGLAIMIAQGFAALFLAAAAYEYFRARAEAPRALTIMAFLNLATAICFAMSCAMLVLAGETMLKAPPHNWAETLGRAVSIVTVIGMGSIALVLNHWRVEKQRLESEGSAPRNAGGQSTQGLGGVAENGQKPASVHGARTVSVGNDL